MKKKLLTALLAGAVLVGTMTQPVFAEGKSFVYGTTGYSEEMGDAGLNPLDN